MIDPTLASSLGRGIRGAVKRALSLSVVLPCYREEANIARVVRELRSAIGDLVSELEIIIVDDGSDDRTGEIARGLREECPEIRVFSHPNNRGYGAALRTGIAATHHEFVLLMDGDGQIDPAAIGPALRAIRASDGVIGYRSPRRDSANRVLLGRLWTRLVNGAFGLSVRDANCAFKILPGAFLRSHPLHAEGALISAEILARAARANLSLSEIPVRHRPRRAGKATGAQPRVIARAVIELLRLRAIILERPAAIAEIPRPSASPRQRDTSARIGTAPRSSIAEEKSEAKAVCQRHS